MKRIILIHYGELALKGKNREQFEGKLIENLKKAFRVLDYEKIQKIFGRLIVYLSPNNVLGFKVYRLKLRAVFGIANFALGWEVRADLEEIKETVLSIVQKRKFKTFAVKARRATKAFLFSSQELNKKIGALVLEKFPDKKVDLEKPALTIFIEIVGSKAYLYFKKEKGAGGLPVGISGKVIVLLSSGLDSPVAAWKMMKRGAQVVFLHFHAYPFTPPEAQDTVKHLVRELSRYQFGARLYLVNLAEIQKEIITKVPEKLRVIFYRRAMFKIAEILARKEAALGIVTGESLGQVASQTLENMRAIEKNLDVPIYRPNIGSDKEEIVGVAKEIGTYELSIRPYPDCCAYMVPRHPETKADPKKILEVEKGLNLSPKINQAFKEAELWKI